MSKSFRLFLCLGLVLSQGIMGVMVSAKTTSSKKLNQHHLQVYFRAQIPL